MRIPIAGLVVSCLYVASSLAQTGSTVGPNTQEINAQNANNVCRVYFSTPKPGMGQQYEVGRKKHMQFHRDQKDTWTWNTFAIETGDNAGMYVTSSCGHNVHASISQKSSYVVLSETRCIVFHPDSVGLFVEPSLPNTVYLPNAIKRL